MDLPGTYSILANSVEEEIARDFICFGNPHVTVVVTDATSLERNLNLVLQVMEITDKVVLCVNLMDEAKRKNIHINLKELEKLLGIPVVGTTARSGEGLEELKSAIAKVASGKIQTNPKKVNYDKFLEKSIKEIETHINDLIGNRLNSRWVALHLLDGNDELIKSINDHMGLNLSQHNLLNKKLENIYQDIKNEFYEMKDLRDYIVTSIVKTGEDISKKVVSFKDKNYNQLERKIDGILTSKTFGIPIMIALLGIVFWITIKGANVPSNILAKGLFWIEARLSTFLKLIKAPIWVHDILVLGVYRTLACVISVMLPPMAIFFPLFTLLEDLGYLPR